MRLGFIVSLLLMYSVYGYSQNDHGLRFRSYESPIAERTTLHLSPAEAIEFDQSLEVQFELSMWRVSELGYILRFSTDDLNTRIDLLYMPGKEGDIGGIFKLSINGRDEGQPLQIPYSGLVRNQWISCQLKIDRFAGQVQLKIDGQSTTLKSGVVSKLESINPVFGRSPFGLPSAVATPSFSVKNLQLSIDKDSFFWPLKKQEATRIYSENDKRSLEIQNPEWIADLHGQWQLRHTQPASPIPGLSFDPTTAEVYMVDDALISVYSLTDQTVKEFVPGNRFPKDQGTQAALYSTQHQQLYGYNLGPVKAYEFNKDRLAWEKEPEGDAPPIYIWQHAPFENALNGSPMIFAGYGFFTAKNNLLALDTATQEWSEVPLIGSLPAPRFMHGITAGFQPGEYFIYGGYGNESGDQELGFQNLNDLYVLDLKDSSVRKVWGLPAGSTKYLPSSSMVLSLEDSSIYALGHDYLSGSKVLELLKISINEPNVEVVALEEKLPFEIRNIGDYNLFLYFAEQTNELVSVLRINTDESHAEVRIHTMLFPPKGIAKSSQTNENHAWVWYLLGLVGVLVLLVLIRKGRKGSRLNQSAPAPEASVSTEEPLIRLLGGFKIADREGQEMTGKLSPKLKELFLLILLHSVGGKGGISTKKLTHILWPDSTAASAKNNRGVNLQKLRQALKNITAVEILFKENQWVATLSDPGICDLEHAFTRLKSNDLDGVNSITGPLLPGTTYEWLDTIKVDVHHQLIQLLINQIIKHESAADWGQVVMLSRNILLIDPVHDDALSHQLKAMVRLKKVGQAQATYEQFAERFRQLYNEPYPVSFEEILA